jgi:tetratricopeptide (TPR) repeat protein
MGQAPLSLGWGGDGVTFEVFANRDRLFLEHLPLDQAKEGWHEREVDLAAYVGQTIHLSLATTPGPTGDITGDWAAWGEPRLEDAQAWAYRQAVKNQPWRAKLKEMGVTAADWIQAGELARKTEQYETALARFDWVERLSPERGDAWYYRGLVYEDREQWTLALSAYAHAIELGSFRQAPSSGPHYRSGVIYQRRLPTPSIEAALALYDQAIEMDGFTVDRDRADCHYRRAEILRLQKADPELYIAGFRRAIEIYPRHSGAHLLLGVSIYGRDKDFATAEAELLLARELAPQGKWPCYHLGRIYEQEGDQEQAERMYSQALEIDPSFEAARERLEALRAR